MGDEKHHIGQVPFYGTVEDNGDPEKSCRLRVRVMGINDDVPVEGLPWCEQAGGPIANQVEVPAVGRQVEVVRHIDGTARWKHLDFKDKGLIELIGDDDYAKSVVLSYKDLKSVGGEGIMAIMWSLAEGVRVSQRPQAYFPVKYVHARLAAFCDHATVFGAYLYHSVPEKNPDAFRQRPHNGHYAFATNAF